MNLVYVHITFKAQDLQGKTWGELLDEILADVKKQKLDELNKIGLPKNMTTSVVLTFTNNDTRG